jgi:hypothetical protein
MIKRMLLSAWLINLPSPLSIIARKRLRYAKRSEPEERDSERMERRRER